MCQFADIKKKEGREIERKRMVIELIMILNIINNA